MSGGLEGLLRSMGGAGVRTGSSSTPSVQMYKSASFAERDGDKSPGGRAKKARCKRWRAFATGNQEAQAAVAREVVKHGAGEGAAGTAPPTGVNLFGLPTLEQVEPMLAKQREELPAFLDYLLHHALYRQMERNPGATKWSVFLFLDPDIVWDEFHQAASMRFIRELAHTGRYTIRVAEEPDERGKLVDAQWVAPLSLHKQTLHIRRKNE